MSQVRGSEAHVEANQQKKELQVSVKEMELAGASGRAMWVHWDSNGAGDGLSAYDVNLLLENGRVLQLAQGLPAGVHEWMSTAAASGKARVQVVGVQADNGGLAQGLGPWMELPDGDSSAASRHMSHEQVVWAANAPSVSSVNPSTLSAGTTVVTIHGMNLPLSFGYALTNLYGQPLLGTGTGFPSGSSTSVSVPFYVASNVPPGQYLLRVSNQAGSTSVPVYIATALRAPTISYLDPSLIYPDNSGPTRQLIVGGDNLPTSVSGYSVSSQQIGLSLAVPNPSSAILVLSNLTSVPSGRYTLTASNAAGSASRYFDIVRFF
ncbi:hypothetical protein [Pyxidicoccus caerfyrddinensis]|uniref:hypothetical protein n=1 Tax=Pyxidicoccus caerfyrddinensis TaxID=2709663 RepID=UPI0013DB34C6|nr:hypothetical protein [Pyxidicoccus caerfyrddinensis]